MKGGFVAEFALQARTRSTPEAPIVYTDVPGQVAHSPLDGASLLANARAGGLPDYPIEKYRFRIEPRKASQPEGAHAHERG